MDHTSQSVSTRRVSDVPSRPSGVLRAAAQGATFEEASSRECGGGVELEEEGGFETFKSLCSRDIAD